MENTNTEGLISCQCEDDQAVDKLPPADEKPCESHTGSSTAQPEPQCHEVVPGAGVTGLITQMDVSVSGIMKKDSELVSEICTAEITPHLSEAMETCMSEQDRAQHPETSTDPVENDSTGHEVIPESGIAETAPKWNEKTETSMSEQNGGQRSDAEKSSVEKDTMSPLIGGGGSLALLRMQYRDESSDDVSESSESDSSSSTSTSSSSSSSEPVISKMNEFGQDEDEEGVAPGKKAAQIRTQDEVLVEDLPAVENLTISLPDSTNLEQVGIISSIVDQLVIIESKKDTPALNDDSVLFSKDRVSIGRVFEVFGPVCQPYYILRFNSQEDIEQKGLTIREPVYFAPKIKDFTDYIFVEQIKQTKGSDASWKNDQEPPPEALDFSDDEQERMAKQKLKTQRRSQQSKQDESDSDSESCVSRPPPPPRRKPRQNRNSPRGRPGHHEHHGGFHANYHANPHFQQDFIHHPPNPYRPPFQGHGYPPYPQAPHPHMGIDPWHPCPYPGPIFYPPPPPPPPPSN